MLISTDCDRTPAELWKQVRSWPGPHCLGLTSHALPPRPWMEAAQAHFFIFQHATPQVTPLLILRDIVLCAATNPAIRPEGPLLFASGPLTSSTLRSAKRLVRADPFCVDVLADSETGALQRLLLGHKILENPLFRVFLASMSPDLGNGDTENSLNILKEHLVPHD